jgi:hypothetical protein
MADYSKQWCELNDPDMPHDFDILEEFEKLPKDHYIPIICEGFGFISIGRNPEGELLFAVPTGYPKTLYLCMTTSI